MEREGGETHCQSGEGGGRVARSVCFSKMHFFPCASTTPENVHLPK